MALKTGYKVKGKEIILDDYNNFGPPTGISIANIKAICNGTLNEYNVGGQEINASKYVEGKGQILAELPGDNYYKAPSGVQKFALYGTNTVGGWIDGVESNKWQKFEGNGVGEENKIINIMFDGQKLGRAEQDSAGVSYYMVGDPIREYEYSSDEIKLWCIMVSAGGGGGSDRVLDSSSNYAAYSSGGGSGGSAVVCISLKSNEILSVIIPQKSQSSSDGETLTLSIIRGTSVASKTDKILQISGGKAGRGSRYPVSGGDGGSITYIDDKVIGVNVVEGTKGVKGGVSKDDKSDDIKGSNSSTELFNKYNADYIMLYPSLTINGGNPDFSSGGHYVGGGGASCFPEGKGGYYHTELGYVSPGPGGGGGGVGSYIQAGYGGAGAFWLLYA